MAKTLDTLINELVVREGGYSNHPSDRGGPTMYGITEHQARAYGYGGDMRSLPRSKAVDIYKDIYWNKPKLTAIALRMPRLAEELFDTGVNMGPSRAIKMLQRALNVLNRGNLDYPDLSVDGDFGRMSVYALNSFIQRRGVANAEKVLLRATDSLQAVRYIEIAEANTKQEDFVYGWLLNRVGGVE